MYSSFGPTMPNVIQPLVVVRSVVFSSFFNPVTKFSSLLLPIKRQKGRREGRGGEEASLTKSMAYITEVTFFLLENA